MLSVFKVFFGLVCAIALGLGMALGLDWLIERTDPNLSFSHKKLVVPVEKIQVSQETSFSTEKLDAVYSEAALNSGFIVDAFISEVDPERRAWELRQGLEDASLDELEDLFIEALSYDLEDRRALQVAGIALKRIAQTNSDLGLGLLHTLSPAEKEKLAWAVASGWALTDAMTAWDWISTAWVDSSGNFIDRDLQNRLHREAVDVLLKENQDYQLAASLVSSLIDPDLKQSLADLIAFRAVTDNPSQALARIDFSSNDFLDTAIMDAIMDEWAQRDSFGAKEWTLENEEQVSTKGARTIAKNLLLNEAQSELRHFHGRLLSVLKRDSVAAEATRLLARRDPVNSVDWLHAIQSATIKREATYDALYEIGHDSFESTIQYVDLAYDSSNPGRELTLYAALESWTRVDEDLVTEYLDSGKSGMPQVSVNEFKLSLGIQ